MSDDPAAGARLALRRDSHIFARRPALADRLAGRRAALPLAPDQLLHADVPAEYLVRLGKLRVTQLLPDGREVTRAVLQAGAGFVTLPAADDGAGNDPAADVYPLADTVLMALGDAEIWSLPPGSLDLDD